MPTTTSIATGDEATPDVETYSGSITKNSERIPRSPPPLIEEYGRMKVPIPPKDIRIRRPTLSDIKAWCSLYGPPYFPAHVLRMFDDDQERIMSDHLKIVFRPIWKKGRYWRSVTSHEKDRMWAALPNEYRFFDHFSGKWALWDAISTKWQKKNDYERRKSKSCSRSTY
jgi:hypothetical protein